MSNPKQQLFVGGWLRKEQALHACFWRKIIYPAEDDLALRSGRQILIRMFGFIPRVAAFQSLLLAQLVPSVSHHDLRQGIESLQSGVHLPT